jgi:hypothetical protein
MEHDNLIELTMTVAELIAAYGYQAVYEAVGQAAPPESGLGIYAPIFSPLAEELL